jgi:hypothetical protein
MDTVIFADETHADFFSKMMEQCGKKEDPYCRALFYLLALCGETRRNIDSMFDFEGMGIKPEALRACWQTGGTIRLTRLAYNLWNGWAEEGCERLSAPYELFDCGFARYFLEAIKLRYPDYCKPYCLSGAVHYNL